MDIRYIFHGGTRETNADKSVRRKGIAHNSAFYSAALNVKKDYDGNVKIVKITTAEKMVQLLNSNTEGTVTSLDILSHGTPYSLNFSIKENENCGLVTGMAAKLGLKIYYSSWDDGVYSFSVQSRYISDINFKVFTDDARIQIHGCNTARGSIPGDTLTETISKELFAAGKSKAYVIGHTTKSNPNISGEYTTIAGQDYRHGRRAIIYNGELLKETTKKGLLSHNKILSWVPVTP
jgi:hypothetical protein